MFTLYGGPTTNTRKVTIALEELGLAYSSKAVSLDRKEQMQDWFLKLSPNNKFPVLRDEARDHTVWESGAILIYLADHYDASGCILPKEGIARYAAIQGAFFQAAHIGPNLGRLNDQLTASDDQKIPAMLDLFYNEAVRLTGVLDRMLEDGRPFVAGNYSIADIMHYPWLAVGLEMQFPAMMDKPRIPDWLHRIAQRPAVQKGMNSFE